MQPLGGLIFDPSTARWTVRQDLDIPLDADQDAMSFALLARDNPADESNSFRSKANAYVACRRLARRAECEHGDEARVYYVFCGQKLLCRNCGTGESLTRQLKRENIELYALANASRHQVQKFSLEIGTPCGGPFPEMDLDARFKLSKFLYRKLKAALDRQAEAPYGAKFFPVLDPGARSLSFHVLWIDMPRTLHKIRSMWEAICVRNWKRIAQVLLKARGIVLSGNSDWSILVLHEALHANAIACQPQTQVTSQQYDQGSAAKSLASLFSGLAPILTYSARARLKYAEPLFGQQLGITSGSLRGKALEDAAEGLWEDGLVDDEDDGHGECSNHHTPLRMSMAAPAPVSEIQRIFPRVWFGPIATNRVKPLHAPQCCHAAIVAQASSPPS
jgi:hypothetical protein